MTSSFAVQVCEELVIEQIIPVIVEKTMNGPLGKHSFAVVSAQIEESQRFRRATLRHLALITVNCWMT